MAADADYMAGEMLAGLEDSEADELENRDYKRSSDGRFASTGAGQNNPRHEREGRTGVLRKKKAEKTEKSDREAPLFIPEGGWSPSQARQKLVGRESVSLEYKNGTRVGKSPFGAIAPDTEIEFFVTGRSVDELLSYEHVSRSADRASHYAAAANVAELWEKSTPKAKYRDRKIEYEKSDIEWVHKRTANMRVGESLYEVEITAKEMKKPMINPHVLYQVKTRKMKQ